MNAELLKMLKDLAAQSISGDNPEFNACEYSGGNYDDAYELGRTDGEINLARVILERYGLEK